MPSNLTTRLRQYKYDPVGQNENDLEHACMASGHGEGEHGSGIVYHEMMDMDSEMGNEMTSTAALDGFDTPHIGFWSQSPWKYRRARWFCGCMPSDCDKFTSRELVLLLLTVLLTLIMTIVVVVRLPADVCTTRECVAVAGAIINTLDETVNPCEDFYEFACGGWKRRNPLPSGHAYWNTFAVQRRDIDVTLKTVLEQKLSNNTVDSSERKVKLFYKSCMDLESINGCGAEPLKDLIDMMGGWSINGNWSSKNFNLSMLLGRAISFGVNTFFSFAVGTDLKNVSSNMILIDEGVLNLGKRKFYINKTLDDQILHAYHKYMIQVCILLGGEETTSVRLMGNIIRLEQRLAEIQMSAEKARYSDLFYQHMKIEDLQDICPVINWIDVVNSSFASILPDETIATTELIGTSSSKYFRNLTEIIQSTSAETLNNYVIWQLVSALIPGLGEDFLSLRAKLNKKIFGSDSSCIERWHWCVSATDESLGLALGKLFVENNFDHKSKDMAQLMVKEIKDAFKRNLPGAVWIDQETKDMARNKVDAVRDKIGYPDYILNQSRVDDEYLDLNLTDDMSYFEMISAFHKFAQREMLKNLRKPVDMDDWEMTPPTTNAYYDPTKNTIVFPAGILQPPAYSSNYPQSINFGGIGLVVGHELSHGFDDEGRKFGIDGDLDNWWKNETLKKFQKKAECMIEQYSKYSIAGKNVNGNITLGENIADNGGIRLAYDAYMRWRQEGDALKDPLLPSLTYTHEQLFFIAFAQLWCSVSTDQHMKESTLLGSHSPSKIRVIGVLANSPEFSDAFQCLAGSPMNPEKKCRVW